MNIAKDAFVIIEYQVRLEDGTFVKGERGPVSMNFVVGYEQVLPGLERRLIGASEGAEMEFVIPAREAFGDHDPTQVHVRPLNEFPEGMNLRVGHWMVATNEETGAQYGYYVKDRTHDSVTLDFNHPLAGKDLHYRLKVVRVRPATLEELIYLRPCEHGEAKETASSGGKA